MLDHMGFPVSDIARSKAFYDAALAPLGMTLMMTITPEMSGNGGTALGYGKDGHPFFWVGDDGRSTAQAQALKVGEGTHVALRVDTREEVHAFHAAALAAGGTDHGAPGLRAQYGPSYYAAFVLDPDGANIEAVCYAPR